MVPVSAALVQNIGAALANLSRSIPNLAVAIGQVAAGLPKGAGPAEAVKYAGAVGNTAAGAVGVASQVKGIADSIKQGLDGAIKEAILPIGLMKTAFSRVTEVVSTVVKPLTMFGEVASAVLVKAPQAIAGAVKDFVAAFTTPITVLRQLGDSVQGFVAALNPAPVLQWQLAMHNLTAAFGYALQPLLESFTRIAREMNSFLTPAFERLRPIIAQVGDALASIGTDTMGALASILKSLTPAFQFLADVLDAVVPAFRVLAAGIAGFVSVIAGVFRNIREAFGFGGGIDGFKDAMRRLAESALLAAASILKFVDSILGTTFGDDFIKGVVDALGGGERRETVGAPRNPMTTGFSEFGSMVARNSLLAGVGGASPEDKAKQQREEMIKILQEIDNHFPSLFKMVNDIAAAAIPKVYEKTPGALAGAAIGSAIMPGIGTAIGGIIGATR